MNYYFWLIYHWVNTENIDCERHKFLLHVFHFRNVGIAAVKYVAHQRTNIIARCDTKSVKACADAIIGIPSNTSLERNSNWARAPHRYRKYSFAKKCTNLYEVTLDDFFCFGSFADAAQIRLLFFFYSNLRKLADKICPTNAAGSVFRFHQSFGE